MDSRHRLVSLDSEIDFYLSQALASNTHRTYQSRLRSFHLFCSHASLPTLPVLKHNLLYYVASLGKWLTFNTIRTYVVTLPILLVYVWSSNFLVKYASVVLRHERHSPSPIFNIPSQSGTNYDPASQLPLRLPRHQTFRISCPYVIGGLLAQLLHPPPCLRVYITRNSCFRSSTNLTSL